MNTPSVDVLNVVRSSCSCRRIAVLPGILLRLGLNASGGPEKTNGTPRTSLAYTDVPMAIPTHIMNSMRMINHAVRTETPR